MTKKNIMIVDDSDEILMELKALLEENSFNVLEFESSQKAAEHISDKEEDISLFIFDYHMPIMNGLELCERVRQNKAFENTPIFMLTSERNYELIKKGKEKYGTQWMIKPLNPPVLIKHISQLVEQKIA